jgi:O-antigen ligase
MGIVKNFIKSNTLFIVLAFLIPLSLFLQPGFVSASVILLFLSSWLYRLSNPEKKFGKNHLLFYPIGLFLLFLVSTLYSQNLGEAKIVTLKQASLFLIPASFILAGRPLTARNVDQILLVFLGGCLGASLVCCAQASYNVFCHGSLSVPSVFPEKEYFLSNLFLTRAVKLDPIYFGMFINLAFAISIQASPLKKTSVRVILALYFAIFELLIASKIGIVSLISIAILWILMKCSPGIRRYLMIGALISLFVAGIYTLPFLKERFITSTHFTFTEKNNHSWNSITHRLAIWSCAREAVWSRWLTGYGTGDGQTALENVYREKGFAVGLEKKFNAHNEFLSVWLDLGIPGLILILAVVAGGFYHSFRTKDFIAMCFITIVFLSFMVESVLLRQKGVAFFSFFFVLLFSVEERPQNSN